MLPSCAIFFSLLQHTQTSVCAYTRASQKKKVRKTLRLVLLVFEGNEGILFVWLFVLVHAFVTRRMSFDTWLSLCTSLRVGYSCALLPVYWHRFVLCVCYP